MPGPGQQPGARKCHFQPTHIALQVTLRVQCRTTEEMRCSPAALTDCRPLGAKKSQGGGSGVIGEPFEDREGCGQRTLQVGEQPSHFWGALGRVGGLGLGQDPGLPAWPLGRGLSGPTLLRGHAERHLR